MPTPKSVVKISKKGIEYTSNVPACQYYLYELSRGALRDVGKFVAKIWKDLFYSNFKKQSGNAGKATKYKVISGKSTTHPRVQIGLKTGKVDGFYAYYQEFGSSKTPKLGLLSKAVNDNISKIIEIESKYLSAIDTGGADALIDESDLEGGADE